ncbi:rop guanine nucleotide exchange factor, partial [Trifolium pratense]
KALDSMVKTEFWYGDGGSRIERKDKKEAGSLGKGGMQVFKAGKSINENVLLEIPVPAVIKDAHAKSFGMEEAEPNGETRVCRIVKDGGWME